MKNSLRQILLFALVLPGFLLSTVTFAEDNTATAGSTDIVTEGSAEEADNFMTEEGNAVTMRMTDAEFKSQGVFNQDNYNAVFTKSDVGFEVIDLNAGTPEVKDTVAVEMKNITTGEDYTLQLEETRRDSQIFRTNLNFIREFDIKLGEEGYVLHAFDELEFTYNTKTAEGKDDVYTYEITAVGKAQIMVSPMRVFLHLKENADVDHPQESDYIDVERGSTLVREFTIRNIGDDGDYFDLSLDDFYKDAEGKITFVKEGETNPAEEYSLKNWISFRSPSKFFLEADESRKIEFAVNIPEDAEAGSYYTMVTVGMDPKTGLFTGSTLIPNTEVSLPLLLNVGEPGEYSGAGKIDSLEFGKLNEKKTEFTSLGLIYFGAERELANTTEGIFENLPFALKLDYANEGDIVYKPQGYFRFKQFGSTFAEVPFEPNGNSVFPHAVQTYYQSFASELLGNFWCGPYTVELNLQDADGTLSTMSVTFWAFSYHVLYGALAVLVLVAIYVVYKVIRKIKSKKEVVKPIHHAK